MLIHLKDVKCMFIGLKCDLKSKFAGIWDMGYGIWDMDQTRDKRVTEIDYQLKYAIFSTACSIVYKYVHAHSANICIQGYLRIL